MALLQLGRCEFHAPRRGLRPSRHLQDRRGHRTVRACLVSPARISGAPRRGEPTRGPCVRRGQTACGRGDGARDMFAAGAPGAALVPATISLRESAAARCDCRRHRSPRRGHARGAEGALGNDAPRAALQRMQSGAGHASVRVCVCDCIYVSALPCLSVRSCLRARLLEQRRVVQLNHTLAHGGARQKF